MDTPVNQSMTFEKTVKYFEDNGFVESNTPKNRKKFYQYLKDKEVRYRTEIIGYINGRGDMCRWTAGKSIGWDLGRIVKWINDKRILPDDLKQVCNRNHFRDWFSFDDIKDVFNEIMSNRERYDLIKKMGHNLERIKYTPFDCYPLRKTIVRISKM